MLKCKATFKTVFVIVRFAFNRIWSERIWWHSYVFILCVSWERRVHVPWYKWRSLFFSFSIFGSWRSTPMLRVGSRHPHLLNYLNSPKQKRWLNHYPKSFLIVQKDFSLCACVCVCMGGGCCACTQMCVSTCSCVMCIHMCGMLGIHLSLHVFM